MVSIGRANFAVEGLDQGEMVNWLEQSHNGPATSKWVLSSQVQGKLKLANLKLVGVSKLRQKTNYLGHYQD